MVSEELIKKIIDNADIVKVISTYIPLEKKGSDYKGICPFHDDTDPSLSVSPTKKVFKCFSCGTSGNAVSFIQKYKNVSFLDALKEVAQTEGINLDIGSNDIKSQKNKKYYNIMEETSSFYKFYLQNTDEGKIAIDYLNNRKLSEEIINRFNIGLAPEKGDLVTKMLLDKNYSNPELVEVGLSRQSTKNGEYYDLFKNRIMFPITNYDGKCVGFSGRLYKTEKDDNNPKYINTLDTVIFKKGNILYHYYESINAIKAKNKVFLFEGFMDVIASVRCGINNCVASMGTALTLSQIKALSKLTNNIVLCYDGDLPGIEATKKAIMLLYKQHISISVITLPDELDPDEYINKYGNQKLNNLLTNEQVSAMDYLYGVEKNKLFIDDFNTVINFKKAIFKFISYFNDKILETRFLQKLANDINVSYDTLIQEYTNSKKYEIKKIEPKSVDYEVQDKDSKHKRDKYLRYRLAEIELLKIAYYDKIMCLKIDYLLNGQYVDQRNMAIFQGLVQYYNSHDVMNRSEFENTIEYYKDYFSEIIDKNMFVPPRNDQYLKLIKVVEEYIPALKRDELKNNHEKKVEDLVKLANSKKHVVEIKKIKE